MSKFIPKVVAGTLPEIQDGSMIFDKTSKKIYFDFDDTHQEVKSGEEYQQGTGIKIDNNVISVNETIAKSADLISEVTTARAAENALGTRIDNLTAANIAYTNEEIGEEVQDQKTFNDLMVDTVNNLGAWIDTKQDKLPNATQVGQVLKATNTEGGIAWGEAGSGLPSMDAAVDNDCLKVKIIPANQEFTTELAVNDTMFYINANSQFDFDSITYDDTVDEAPAKILFSFTTSQTIFSEESPFAIVAFKNHVLGSLFTAPANMLTICKFDSEDERWESLFPIYVAKTVSSSYVYLGTWTKGWIFDQTDGYLSIYAMEFKNRLFTSAPNNLWKWATDDLLITAKAAASVKATFGPSDDIIVITPEKKEAIWGNPTGTPLGDNLFYTSNVVEYDFAGIINPKTELDTYISTIYLNRNNEPDFSYFIRYGGFTGTEQLLLSRWDSCGEGIDQGIVLYGDNSGEKPEFALFLCCGDGKGRNVKNIPLYATKPLTFDYTYMYSEGKGSNYPEATYTYTFSQAGWNTDLDEINLTGDSPLSEESVRFLSVTGTDETKLIIYPMIGPVLSTQQGLFYPDTQIKPNTFKSFAKIVSNTQMPQGDAEGEGEAEKYIYTNSSYINGNYEFYTLAYNGYEQSTTQYKVGITGIPEPSNSANGQVLVTNFDWDSQLQHGSRFKWITPNYSTDSVLAYNSATHETYWKSDSAALTLRGSFGTDSSKEIYSISVDPTESAKLENLIRSGNYNCNLCLTNYNSSIGIINLALKEVYKSDYSTGISKILFLGTFDNTSTDASLYSNYNEVLATYSYYYDMSGELVRTWNLSNSMKAGRRLPVTSESGKVLTSTSEQGVVVWGDPASGGNILINGTMSVDAMGMLYPSFSTEESNKLHTALKEGKTAITVKLIDGAGMSLDQAYYFNLTYNFIRMPSNSNYTSFSCFDSLTKFSTFTVTWDNNSISGFSGNVCPIQERLESGTNIKTINNESILGSGNIEVKLPEYDTSTVAYYYDMCFPEASGFYFGTLTPNSTYKIEVYQDNEQNNPAYHSIFIAYTNASGKILGGLSSAYGSSSYGNCYRSYLMYASGYDRYTWFYGRLDSSETDIFSGDATAKITRIF